MIHSQLTPQHCFRFINITIMLGICLSLIMGQLLLVGVFTLAGAFAVIIEAWLKKQCSHCGFNLASQHWQLALLEKCDHCGHVFTQDEIKYTRPYHSEKGRVFNFARNWFN